MIDYQKEFPIPLTCLPSTLRDLLTIGSFALPSEKIPVTARFEKNQYQDGYEYLQMIMACVPQSQIASLGVLRESSDGVVEFSTPCCDEQGGIYPVTPGISGFDYVVASWGDSSRYAYALAEKVWMTLGLSPRVIGNAEQRIIYDDLSLPIIGVAEGDLSSEYHFNLKKDIYWTMRNDYLRKYLWLTGCYGVRVFFYEAYIADSIEVRSLLASEKYYNKTLGNGWCELDIREHDGRILLQIWASVVAITPELCEEQDVYSLVWPGDTEPMKRERVSSFMQTEYAYVDDGFLERYEKDSMFNAVPYKKYDRFFSCPSYKGQWSFHDCQRIGRNLLKISLYELYKHVPEQEIYHAHQYAITPAEALKVDQEEENIVFKTERLLLQLITLGENLSVLIQAASGASLHSSQFIEFNRESYRDEGFGDFPIFQKLLQAAPLKMYEQDFLSRCKTLNEIIGKLKTGSLRKVLSAMGANKGEIDKLQGLKLLQGLLNMVDGLNEQGEDASVLPNAASFVDWQQTNPKLAPLFINNDLRNAEAHEAVGKSLDALERLGFDTSSVNDGYGRALDFLFDGVIEAISTINVGILALIHR